MGYKYSELDKKNLNWMANDNSCATLHEIKLRYGRLRGLFPFHVQFKYPISVVAGENGCGKSTFLAIAACAFHNSKTGYHFKDRSKPYYTFNDFFIQTKDEIPPSGINIGYCIRYDNWSGTPAGLAWQSRKKSSNGRWNNYDTRAPRNVIYFGIQRVVPYYEMSTHKSYCRNFSLGTQLDDDTISQIMKIASRILNKDYTDFAVHEASRYRLPVVKTSKVHYSGFNMGAGESTIFSMLTALFEAGRGALLIIDEIELGLHEKAQKLFIHELKELCSKLHCQIICSTHSAIILESLPPEARFYIESEGGKTIITPGISSAYACGKLAGLNSAELDIFVEDEIGKALLLEVLPLHIRHRTKVHQIGSSEAVLRQIASRHREKQENCLAFLDGDKNSENKQAVAKIKNYLEHQFNCSTSEIDSWISTRLAYLPGNTWPEAWLIEQAQITDAIYGLSSLAKTWGIKESQLAPFLSEALTAGKHKELYTLESNLHYGHEKILRDLISHIHHTDPSVFKSIIEKVEKQLSLCSV